MKTKRVEHIFHLTIVPLCARRHSMDQARVLAGQRATIGFSAVNAS